MGIFDSDFDIENYILKRIPELENLEERDLFKAILSGSTIQLYNHIKDEYSALEQRIFDEAPKALRMPDLFFCVIDKKNYDMTDLNMFPIFPEDLREKKVDAAEMIHAVGNNKEFYLYTCMIKADFLEIKKLLQTPRRFKGVIENEFGETPAEFILKPNEKYLKKIEELYDVAKLNFLPWRCINSAYLYKIFDVFVVSIEQWDDQLEVRKVSTEFDEFSEKILYNPLPIWNIWETTIKANSYPQPAVDRKFFEHYLYKKQFNEGHDYLLKHSDFVIRNIFRRNGDVYIICDSDSPNDWDFYEFFPAPDQKNYENILLSNAQDESFSRNMIEFFGQRIKTRTELVRFFNSFQCKKFLTFVDAKIKNKSRKIETYSMENFIDFEFRTGDRSQTFEFSFRPADEDFYLNRDILSFLITEIQHFFPEYNCVGKLV